MHSLLIASGILLYLFGLCTGLRDWDYELLHASCSTSDENLVNISVRLESGELGTQKFSGIVDWKFDVDENTMSKVKILFSYNGRKEDYHPLPYEIPKMPFYEFIDKYYMRIIYGEFESCSNLPAVDVPFVPPWKKTTYIFNQCLPPADAYPTMTPRGYYLVSYQIIGQAVLTINITLKISPKYYI